MYKKAVTKKGDTEIITINNQDDSVSISIAPSRGAVITKLVIGGEKIIEGIETEEELLTNSAYKSTLLAPFPNRIKDGKYIFEGKNYQLDINEKPRNNALHGFIYNRSFKVLNEAYSSDSAEIQLQNIYSGDLAGYPFKFTSVVTYKLDNQKGFSATLKFTNNEEKNIPFGFGWHPYFTLSTNVDDLTLKTAALKNFPTDSQSIPTGKAVEATQFISGKKLTGINLDDCFLIQETGSIVSTELSDISGKTLRLWQETGEKKLNYLQIYTPPHRKSIAIEPQTCCIDAFNNKFGYFELRPNETILASFGVQFVSE